jgi:hypothetical protein
MKTDQLIDMLSTNVEPVKTGQLKKTLAATLVVGAAASFCVMLTTVGLRTEAGGLHVGYLVLKLLFMLILIGAGTALLAKLIRPGQDDRNLYLLLFVAFIALGVVGVVALVVQPSAAWDRMILGTQWQMCALCIPGFAIVPFAGLIWALRRGAPTHLRRTGAVAGLVAGAVGAVAYAFHCPDDSIPFIALWYGAMVALCALVGAILGPRLLRW